LQIISEMKQFSTTCASSAAAATSPPAPAQALSAALAMETRLRTSIANTQAQLVDIRADISTASKSIAMLQEELKGLKVKPVVQ
jgi:hypothetical protein